MADRTIKPDDTNDLVLQNNDGSAKLELNEDQTVKVTTGSDAGEDFTVNTSQLVVEGDSGNVGIGTSSPASTTKLQASGVIRSASTDGTGMFNLGDATGTTHFVGIFRGTANSTNSGNWLNLGGYDGISFAVSNTTLGSQTERLRIDSSGNVLVTKQSTADSVVGHHFLSTGQVGHTMDAGRIMVINRLTSDGPLLDFQQDNVAEGSISVSGTTVSYNGGHLSRWSQLPDNSRDNSLLKGTVMTNLDQMAEWTHDAVEAVAAQDAVFDEEGNLVTEAVQAVEAQDAYTEENEQLNCMAISSVEGDPNVAGVFVNWDEDDDDFHNDMNVAMTGDMVIRIAQGVTVEKGQLLMSAGDGTAKPQGDDIVKNKTIAKVTSNHVSHTYDDGSFCVPCVLMAC